MTIPPDLPVSPAAAEAIEHLAAATADPQGALGRLADFVTTHAEDRPEAVERLVERLEDPKWRLRLVTALGNSPYLAHVLTRWPEFLDEEYTGEDPAGWNRGLTDAVLECATHAEAARLLRWHKHRTFLGIGLRDLTGEADLPETTWGLSVLADASLEAGYRWLRRSLSQKHGPPMTETEEGRHPARFVILGMGKLGAGELNFSSDVDLIYLYDEDRGGCDGQRPISIKAFFNRLGQELIRLLSEITAEGMVFRIDLRLRPEGASGDLTLSRRSAEVYYESWGRTWERSAMIKARPVAGDPGLGEELLRNLTPFIYRRYLDFAALEAIREMKRQIDHKCQARQDYRRNVKLGYGGIREIEFFAQCHQLIHGGKNPSLRPRATEAVLLALVAANLLPAATADLLITHYRFLRTVEHRLQIERERQVHSLPEEPAAFLGLAKRMHFPDAESFQVRLEGVRAEVHAIYGQLFFDGSREREKQNAHPLVEALLNCDEETESCEEVIRRAGFEHPQQAVGLLELLRQGPSLNHLTEATRGWYGRVAVPLLAEILAAPDQDMALRHAEAFLRKLGYRVNYLALLLEYPPVLKLLIKLFGSSALLSHYLIHHPELMDGLVTTDFMERYRNRTELTRDLEQAMSRATHHEEAMEILREFKHGESLRLGIRDLSGVAEPAEVTSGLAVLAEVILARVVADAREELVARYGAPRWTDAQGVRREAPFAVVAMGKLGGRELSFSSDLDLIFIHGSQGEEQYTDHPRLSMANGQFFTRLGQKIITAITSMTRSGKLYELDMRLRPSGSSGPVVTSLEAFVAYHADTSWLWEQQALTRARPIIGDEAFMRELTGVIRGVLTRPRDREALRQEVVAMRERILAEKSPPEGWIDIKQTRGGVVDVEFLVQYLQLAHAADHPEILTPNLPNALVALARFGVAGREEARILEDAYGLYRYVESHLRLLHGSAENRIAPDERERTRLRRLCHALEGPEVIAALEEAFARVNVIYRRILGGA
ncbi:MAG: bifunctional [glutamate--ammonia ligase]-adenylyl-L-tyrosine phosphorylase/[glutamate--ammonia-ligase] adenylyltransferase [Magnetococcales bacterium]|nr:bifunctional [glutamate--ammonia ligase]-adenylyl-L-tyrosine phosphorylase/[glutamate--ammonia-ligase] adenylyltransferase [Magnetococcales bacterium]